MIQLKVRKFGNTLAVVLPQAVIDRLHTKAGEFLHLLEDSDGNYILTSHEPSAHPAASTATDIISRYRNTLHELAH